MRGWKIAELAGIGVYVHWTFLILPLLVASSRLSAGSGLIVAVEAVLFVLAIFACVVLHELGHALMARQFGIGTRSITLLPIGGVASLARMPERPIQEFAVAVAGPAVNVAIAALLLAGFSLAGSAGLIVDSRGLTDSFLVRLFWANVGLVIFNMLPAFPMDGGRVLRSVLAMWLSRPRATQIAAGIGQLMAILFAVFGIFSQQWMLVFVAMFVFFAGRAESQMVQAQAAGEAWLVRHAMRRQFRMMPAELGLHEAGLVMAASDQTDFPVIDRGHLVGMLARDNVLQMLAQGYGHLRVADVMRPDPPTLDENAPLVESLQRMQAANFSSLPVAHAGRLVGLLPTLQQIDLGTGSSDYSGPV